MIHLEIARIEPAFDGMSFGNAGPYEKIVGRAHGRVDPRHPLNAGIVNLDKAPVDADGRVAYSTDFYLLRPCDMARGNRRLFHDVVNRGGKVALHTLNDALRNVDGGMRIGCNDPSSLVDAGNGFLMREGYAILWCGWQGGGVLPGDGRMAGQFPVATNLDGPIVGTSRDEFVFEHLVDPAVAALSYPSNTDDQSSCTLTIRQHEKDGRTVLSSDQWRFLSPARIEIDRPAGFDASAIYEFIYPARDPIVMGLGFAAVRDLVAFLRHDRADNPLAPDGQPTIERAYAHGVSQSARFLRDFLHQGFNEDLSGGIVFDGVIASVAGSRKSFTNFAFAQPNRFSRQHEDRLFPGDQFPFSYATTTDPVSGRTDGILARCEASGTVPKVIQTESASDFFQGRASLLVTDGRGGEIAIPDTVRLYHLASIQHGGGGDPTVDHARMFPALLHATNPASAAPIHRALLVALDRWVTHDLPPPLSAFPALHDGTLVPASPDQYGFPAIPGVDYPGVVNELAERNYDVEPPVPIPGHDYQVLVPAVDADGNDIAGVRIPDIAVPRGTHTGWSVRRQGHAAGAIGAAGAFFPFPATRRDRLVSGDPRASLEERYQGDYLTRLADAACDLAARRLLLPEDVDRIIAIRAARLT